MNTVWCLQVTRICRRSPRGRIGGYPSLTPNTPCPLEPCVTNVSLFSLRSANGYTKTHGGGPATPSVTPTSSLSSNDTRSTYAVNVSRGTPNSRGSVDCNSTSAAAAVSDASPASASSVAMRNSLALDPGLFRRNYRWGIRGSDFAFHQ